MLCGAIFLPCTAHSVATATASNSLGTISCWPFRVFNGLVSSLIKNPPRNGHTSYLLYIRNLGHYKIVVKVAHFYINNLFWIVALLSI